LTQITPFPVSLSTSIHPHSPLLLYLTFPLP
jgi:hypothetical protein